MSARAHREGVHLGQISARQYRRAVAGEEKPATAVDATPAPLTVGAILVSRWGYDQTNVDYYEVVSATPKTVTLRAIRSRVTGDAGFTAEHVAPVPGEYTGEAFRRKVHHYSDRPTVAINSCASAYPWNGNDDLATHYA
ncbi:hypothetical protein [Microbacterium aurantiacum]|uniref:hypothetical protein n=1 Tax=Microbacterium aurantiacum TaxID=162393 RepID=UPI0006AD4FA7|nr:hypothetical protein [Microbacterium chocolatum]ANG86368.1 hypothetical protein A8L33_14280 [Microbacterium chocolatum]